MGWDSEGRNWPRINADERGLWKVVRELTGVQYRLLFGYE
jgi:hypothetical protein